MIPNNQEHLEAYQAEVDRKRAAFFAQQSPEVQANLSTIENAVKELDKLNVPFTLFVNPFGWEFRDPDDPDNENKKQHDFWRFQKMAQGEFGTQESWNSINETMRFLVSAVAGYFKTIIPPDKWGAFTIFDKKTNAPEKLYDGGAIYSITPPKL